MTDWANAASLATAGGTLVLAVATFASIRSANRSARMAERAARIAERSLLAGQRPLLVNSRIGDPEQKIQFAEGNVLHVPGSGADAQLGDNVIYLAASVRNVGTGLAMLHGWHVLLERPNERAHPPLEDFTDQIRDIYIAPGDNGVWQGALRDPDAEIFKAVRAAIKRLRPSLRLSALTGSRTASRSNPTASRACVPGTWTKPKTLRLPSNPSASIQPSLACKSRVTRSC